VLTQRPKPKLTLEDENLNTETYNPPLADSLAARAWTAV
jgi:hypothetical protein